MANDPNPSELEKYRRYLRIDKTTLGDCLTEQPEIYYAVSQKYVAAAAERDQLKLDLEQTEAEVAGELRAKVADSEEVDEKGKPKKITETALKEMVAVDKDVVRASARLIKAKVAADEWAALKEAFGQRSYMLRELVALYLAERHDLAMQNGAGQARTNLADSTRQEAGQMRRNRISRG